MRTLSARNLQFGLFVVSFVMFVFCCANGTYGQSSAFATITGRVLDPKGGAVLNADVTATNTETGITRTIKTTSDGPYPFDNLPPRAYDLTLEASNSPKT